MARVRNIEELRQRRAVREEVQALDSFSLNPIVALRGLARRARDRLSSPDEATMYDFPSSKNTEPNDEGRKMDGK